MQRLLCGGYAELLDAPSEDALGGLAPLSEAEVGAGDDATQGGTFIPDATSIGQK